MTRPSSKGSSVLLVGSDDQPVVVHYPAGYLRVRGMADQSRVRVGGCGLQSWDIFVTLET